MLNKFKKAVKQHLTKVEIKAETIPILEGELLANKVALITGGNSGIGFGIASSFIKNGASVIITGRNEDKLKKACEILGSSSRYITWDACSVADINNNLEQCISMFGKIDILVNNAGYHGNQNFLTISENDYDATFDVNLKFVFFLSQAIAKYYIDNSIDGNILNISSAASNKPAWSPYEISKWGVRGFTKGLARELAPNSIVVNGIAPGPCATEMSHWSEGDSLNWPSIPAGRMSLPQELGNLATFLVSDMGRNIIGETVFCDGGSGTLTVNR